MPKAIDPKIIEQIVNLARTNPEIESIESLSNKFSVSKTSICTFLRNAKVHLINTERFKHAYTIDENFFSNIDTPVKAQILGFIYADGCIMKKNKILNINLSVIDKDYLQNINSILKNTGPIRCYKTNPIYCSRTGKKYQGKDRCMLTISRKRIYDDLEKIGVVPRKTWANLGIPKIPYNLIKYFILGFFEGDGSISIKNTNKNKTACFTIAVGKKIAGEIADFFLKELKIPKLKLDKGKNIYSLTYASQEAVTRICTLLYQDHTGLRMERKYNKWQEAQKLYNNPQRKIFTHLDPL